MTSLSRRQALITLLLASAALCAAQGPVLPAGLEPARRAPRRDAPTLRVLTFNVWGLPTAPDRLARIQHFAHVLASGVFDLVGLQEVWLEPDRRALIDAAAAGGLAHAHVVGPGRVGSGLVLLSRYPLTDAAFTRYSLNGDPFVADHYVPKGIAFARADTPLGVLDVYLTHAIAQHAHDDARDRYLPHRIAQMAEFALHVNARSTDRPVIALGDFNVRPDELGYRALAALGGLTDCFTALHPGDPGDTYSEANPYNVDRRTRRLDYIFVRAGGGVALTPRTVEVVLTHVPDESPGPPLPAYSDHYGVLAELGIAPAPSLLDQPATPESELHGVLAELSEALRAGRNAAEERRSRRVTRTAGGLAAASALYLGSRGSGEGQAGLRRWLRGAAGAAAAYSGFEGWLAAAYGPREAQAFTRLIEEVEALPG